MKPKDKKKPLKSYFIVPLMVAGAVAVAYAVINGLGFYISINGCDSRSMGDSFSCHSIVLSEKLDRNMITTIGTHSDGTKGQRKDYNESYIKDTVKIGDIVIYVSGKDLVVHRVIDTCTRRVFIVDEHGTPVDGYAYNYSGFIIKGDNNNNDDGCIPYDDLISKVVWHT